MSEEEMKSAVRGLNEAIQRKELENVLSFYAEDATLETPEATFKGRKEIRRYWVWQIQSASDITGTEATMMVQGNQLAAMHVYDVTRIDGTRWRAPITCLYEFTGARFQRHRMSYDRLSIAKQAAKGWLAKRLVNSIVGQMEKGLH